MSGSARPSGRSSQAASSSIPLQPEPQIDENDPLYQELLKSLNHIRTYTRTVFDWIRSEPTWKNRLGNGWEFKKLLGHGASGAASWFVHNGDDPDMPEIKNVVIKLVLREYLKVPPNYQGLAGEGSFLELMNTVETKHVTKMYGDAKKDHTGRAMFFLEYCPGGSMEGYVENGGEKLSEKDLWSAFECMAKGITAMDRGSEDLSVKIWDRPEIIHYDIIPSNGMLESREA